MHADVLIAFVFTVLADFMTVLLNRKMAYFKGKDHLKMYALCLKG